MAQDTMNIIIVGVGGQGIILASEVLTEAALKAGFDVRKTEVHGMAQRGGSVTSHIRFGDTVKSPLIEQGQADIMLAFEKAEGLRYCGMVKPDATIIMNNIQIIPTTVSIGLGSYPGGIPEHIEKLGYNLVMVNALKTAFKAGTPKAANVVMLAHMASYLDIDREIWVDVIKSRVPEKFLDVNLAAFDMGYNATKA